MVTKGRLLWFISAQSHKIRINSPGLYTQNGNRVSPVISGSGETSVRSQVCPEANAVSKTHPVMMGTPPRRKVSQGLARGTWKRDRSSLHLLFQICADKGQGARELTPHPVHAPLGSGRPHGRGCSPNSDIESGKGHQNAVTSKDHIPLLHSNAPARLG